MGYNRRGFEETEVKVSKDRVNASDQLSLLDRNKCFGVVATAIKDAVSDSTVDLKCPEVRTTISFNEKEISLYVQ